MAGMKNAVRCFLAASSLSTCVSIAQPACPAETAVSVADVLEMMDKVPVTEKGTKPYRWRFVHDAQKLAPVIAKGATSRQRAAKMVIYGAFESGFSINAAGDCDPPTNGQLGACHSFGWLQLSDKRIAPELARDPEVAARTWNTIADQSQQDCASLPEDERDAQLASGNCSAGHRLAARRAALVRRVLGE